MVAQLGLGFGAGIFKGAQFVGAFGEIAEVEVDLLGSSFQGGFAESGFGTD